jgi:hypothetical protein
MDDVETDMLAYMAFPAPRQTSQHQPTRAAQRRDQATQRVVGIFPTRLP